MSKAPLPRPRQGFRQSAGNNDLYCILLETVTPCTTLPMQINPAATGTLPGLTVTLPNSQPLPWQAGQVVSARVLDVAANGHLSLLVQGQSVDARSPLALTAGMQLKLVVELDAGHIVLRILDNVPQQQALAAAWRTALPKQLPLASALQTLVRLLRSMQVPSSDGGAMPQSPADAQVPLPSAAELLSAATTATTAPAMTEGNRTAQPLFPPKVQQLLHALLEQLPTVEQLTTADGLRTALRESGLLLQARLAQGDNSALEHDLQASLLRLSAAVAEELTAAPPSAAPQANSDATHSEALLHLNQTLQQVAQQIDGALAHLKVQQLHTFTARNDTTTVWLFDVPMRQGSKLDVLQLRIQRETRNNDGDTVPAWSVRLHFDMPRHGTIDSVVNLIGSKIGVMFWSETPATAELLKQRMEALRAQLQQAGLDIEQLRSTVGAAPKIEAPATATGGLLHLRA